VVTRRLVCPEPFADDPLFDVIFPLNGFKRVDRRVKNLQ